MYCQRHALSYNSGTENRIKIKLGLRLSHDNCRVLF